jgi:hypothetical protein
MVLAGFFKSRTNDVVIEVNWEVLNQTYDFFQVNSALNGHYFPQSPDLHNEGPNASPSRGHYDIPVTGNAPDFVGTYTISVEGCNSRTFAHARCQG